MNRAVLSLARQGERIERTERPKPRRLGPSAAAARAMVVRALRKGSLHHVLCNVPCTIGIVGVDEGAVDAFAAASRDIMGAWLGGSMGYDVGIHDRTGPRKPKDDLRSLLLDAARGGERAAVLFSSPDDVPAAFTASADGVVTLEPAGHRLLRGIFMSATRQAPDEAGLDIVARLPLDLLDSVVVAGRSVERSVGVARRLLAAVEDREQVSAANATPSLPDRDGPRIEDLSGLGMVGEWGLDLVRDLADYREGRIAWDDVDRGAVVAGPPGVGKTTFAKALARSCGVPLHIHSCATWQARGHLGDLLKAMLKAFSEARKAAPCIMFLDELDAFGSRVDPGDRYSAYTRQVVDGLLEQLDGAEGREGVVVVGATNHPELVDPAIVRPGRLDRVLVLAPPDREAREGILRHHLRGALADADLGPLAARLDGATGAEIELLVRDARRRARRAGHAMLVGDLAAGIPAAVPLSSPLAWRVAVHEAGHLVVGGLLAGVSGVRPVAATLRPDAAGRAAVGETVFERDPGFDVTRESLIAEIVTLLAGMAAEEAVIGGRGVGSGGTATSDLARATVIATLIEDSYGLGSRLSVRIPPPGENNFGASREGPRPASGAAVEAVLRECLGEAGRLAGANAERIRDEARRLGGVPPPAAERAVAVAGDGNGSASAPGAEQGPDG